VYIIKGRAQCQYKVTGWGIIFIWGMVLWCAGILKPGLSLDHAVTADLKTTVVHSYMNCWEMTLNLFILSFITIKIYPVHKIYTVSCNQTQKDYEIWFVQFPTNWYECKKCILFVSQCTQYVCL